MTIEPTSPDFPPSDSPAGPLNDEAAAFESLHPNARWRFRISQIGIAIGLWTPLLLVGRPLLAKPFGSATALVMLLVLLGLLLLWSWQLAGQRFRAERFRLDDSGLSIRRGVYWQSETHVPRSRVQHTDIERGPLDRRLGLTDLMIHTAGSQMATVRLAGLSTERATTLRDALLEGHDQRF